MDGQYVFEEIKQKYKISNKYMLCVTYEDIGILIHIIEMLDKQLKYRKEEINIKSNNINILEELINGFDNLISYKQKQAILNLIAENKELKEEKERIGKLYYETNENCIKYEKIDYKNRRNFRKI